MTEMALNFRWKRWIWNTGALNTDEMMIPYISYTQLDEEGAKIYLDPKDGAYYRFWAF